MEIDFEGLKKYLLGLTAEDIINQVGLKECSCQNEIERQEKRCGKKYIYNRKAFCCNGICKSIKYKYF